MWRARCAAIRDLPDGDPVERRQAMIQYETELRRTRRQTMPVTLELFLKKSWHQRQRLLRGWVNLPSAETTTLRNWMNGTSKAKPDRPPAPLHTQTPAPLQQPTQASNPLVPTNNVPPTPPTRHLTINKKLPRSRPNTNQPRITSFFKCTSQVRAPQRPPVPSNLPPFVPVITTNRPTPTASKRKAPLTILQDAGPTKRTKETHQERLTRRRRRVVQEYAQATNHGGIINLQIMIRLPPKPMRQRPSCQPKGQVRTKLAVGEQVPPKVPTRGVDVDVSR
jgi:hypothetical protein